MTNILLIQHCLVSMDDVDDGSISIGMARRDASTLEWKEPKQEASVSTNWEELYENRYYKRSHKRHRIGLDKVAELCQTILFEEDKYLLEEDSKWETELWNRWKKEIDKTDNLRKNLEPKNMEQDHNVQANAETGIHVSDDGEGADPGRFEADDETGIHVSDDGDGEGSDPVRLEADETGIHVSDDGEGADPGRLEADDETGIHVSDDGEGADPDRLETSDSVIEDTTDYCSNISHEHQDQNVQVCNGEDEREIHLSDAQSDNDRTPGLLAEEHYVSSEKIGDATLIRVLCGCGAAYQLLVTESDSYLRMTPTEDMTAAKLVWASESPNLIGIDCKCGQHGFLFRKSGSSFLYSMQ